MTGAARITHTCILSSDRLAGVLKIWGKTHHATLTP